MKLVGCLAALCSLLLLASVNPSDSAKVLAPTFFSSKSHKIVYLPLLLELAKRGHEVTIVSPIDSKLKVANVREIVTIDIENMMGKEMPNLFELKEKNQVLNPFMMVGAFSKLCRESYDLPEIKSLLNEKFDLIIIQPIFNDCVMGLVHHFNTSIVMVSLISAPPLFTWVTGTPSPPSFVPHFFLSYTDKMSYYERMVNFGVTILMDLLQNLYFKPHMAGIYREKLGDPSIPSVNDILANTSLILSNGHFSLSPPKPFLPDTVEVGGMHCRPAKPLSKDLEDFVNSSGKDGFIFFSMGSAIQAHTMPEKTRKLLINVFSKLKQKVLWKWETEEMPDLPKNVKLGKWLPQQDILGHPKIRLFITHGGYGSTTEAVYHGAPLLGIPMFGDQNLNMQKSEKSGFALTIDFNDLTEEKLLTMINRLVNEPSFTEKAKSLSKIFRDQIDKPLDRATFWVEYVLRNAGAVHMRSESRNLNFLQYHSIDVIASYVAIIFVTFYTVFAICRFLLRKLCGSCKASKIGQNNRSTKKKN